MKFQILIIWMGLVSQKYFLSIKKVILKQPDNNFTGRNEQQNWPIGSACPACVGIFWQISYFFSMDLVLAGNVSVYSVRSDTWGRRF